MTEQLAFEQRFGERRAVDRHEGAFLARAVAVQGARRDLLAGSALAANQHGGVRRSHLGDELVDLPHGRAFADHAVLDADLLDQAPVLALQPLRVAAVLQGDGGDARDRRHELQVVFRKTRAGIAGVEINRPLDLAVEGQGNAEHRLGARYDQALQALERVPLRAPGFQDRDVLPEHPLQDRAAHADGLRGSGIPQVARNRRDLFTAGRDQEDRAPFGRDDLEDQIQQLLFQVLRAADRIDRRADLQERVQVAGHLAGDRESRQEPVRLEIDRVFAAELHRGEIVDGRFLELDRNPGVGLGRVKQEDEILATDPYPVAVLERPLPDRQIVHEGAVPAVEVADPVASLRDPKHAVVA